MRNGPRKRPVIKPYSGPVGGYGSVRSVAEVLLREGVLLGDAVLLTQQNKAQGFMCVSCAWGKPAKPRPFEICESGVKATAWETTGKRVDPAFFEKHPVSELETWLDYDLEEAGRLTSPLWWNRDTDRYEAVSWERAIADIGRELQALGTDPDQVVFYTSGRAALETSYMFQLLARVYGTNNLPDSSNMCHESTSVALPESIGVSVGTVALQDFEQADLLLYVAHNPGTSSPRILHQLQEAVQRGAKILGFNPLRERGLERFTNPQSPFEMATRHETPIAQHIYQVKIGGDIAWLTGVCKAIIERDDAIASDLNDDGEPRAAGDSAAYAFKAAARRGHKRQVIDHDFIATHTSGFAAFADYCRAQEWPKLEAVSGLARHEMERIAQDYIASDRVMGIYGMGLTQHVAGVENVQMLVNLLLLRGNMGKAGAGICAVRGHSNVQGQRTVGITEKPDLAPLDTLKELYGFEPPRHEGLSTVKACEAMISGDVKAFIALGGNFVRAAPEQRAVEDAWRNLSLTVSIATKLNRSHVIHGRTSYILPCLGRIEIDQQASGPQAVSMEDSLAHFHGSRGRARPAGPHLKSEPAIIAALAQTLLPPNSSIPWQDWVDDYSLIREAIEKTYPAIFKNFNDRLFQPGGMVRPLAARERIWNTPGGKAHFVVPTQMFAGLESSFGQAGVLQLTTLRSNDQFNTTVYGYNDRFRGIKGTRNVVFMNAGDVSAMGLAKDQLVDVKTAIDDGVERIISGFRIVIYDIPAGCCATYFPEANPLVPLSHHDRKAHTPAYKAIPVRITASSRDAVAD